MHAALLGPDMITDAPHRPPGSKLAQEKAWRFGIPYKYVTAPLRHRDQLRNALAQLHFHRPQTPRCVTPA
jgi:hypothetical protein